VRDEYSWDLIAQGYDELYRTAIAASRGKRKAEVA
jgi:hypothetical protein